MDTFLLTAYDYPDAIDRRLAVREQHVELINKLRNNGEAIIGAALLDDSGKMIGSTLILKLSKSKLDKYLQEEPYITNQVWEKISIQQCRIGPSFENL